MLLAAADKPFVNPTIYPSMLYFTNIGSLVNLITPLLGIVAAIIFLGMMFYIAFTILTGAGDAAAFEKARKIATFSVIGLLVILLAYLIVRVIGIILHVDVGI